MAAKVSIKPGRVEPVERRSPAARRDNTSFSGRLRNYLGIHFHVLTGSLWQLWKTPFSSVMTAAVIGIALALPAALHVFLGKVQTLGAAWQNSAQISLFLRQGTPEQEALTLMADLQGWEGVSSVSYISPEEALESFQQDSGLGGALELLDQNPLPGVIVVYPGLNHSSALQVEALMNRLQARPEVDIAQLDLEWIQRLHGLIGLADRAVTVLGSLLAFAVLFIVGNTIRMAIQNRQDEIEVVKLIGGSDAFVRRPFLYCGIWYGLFGGLVAWILVNIVLFLLNGPVQQLAALYNSDFRLGSVDFGTTVLLLFFGPLLGLIGAWLVSGKYLRAIEPV